MHKSLCAVLSITNPKWLSWGACIICTNSSQSTIIPLVANLILTGHYTVATRTQCILLVERLVNLAMIHIPTNRSSQEFLLQDLWSTVKESQNVVKCICWKLHAYKRPWLGYIIMMDQISNVFMCSDLFGSSVYFQMNCFVCSGFAQFSMIIYHFHYFWLLSNIGV